MHDITYHTYVHENIRSSSEGFRYDAHPMSMLCSAVAALSSFYPESKNIFDPVKRNISMIRLLAKVPTIAAFIYRHMKGLPFVYPDNELSYAENFLSMVARMASTLPGQSGCSRAPWRCCSFCTPITNRTARPARSARSGRPTSIRIRR